VGQGVNVVFDTVSGPMFEVGLKALAKRGRMVEITVREDHQVSFDLLRFYRYDLQLLGLNTLNLNAVDSAMILEEVARPIETKWLTPQEIEIHLLSEGAEVYQSANQRAIKPVLVVR